VWPAEADASEKSPPILPWPMLRPLKPQRHVGRTLKYKHSKNNPLAKLSVTMKINSYTPLKKLVRVSNHHHRCCSGRPSDRWSHCNAWAGLSIINNPPEKWVYAQTATKQLNWRSSTDSHRREGEGPQRTGEAQGRADAVRGRRYGEEWEAGGGEPAVELGVWDQEAAVGGQSWPADGGAYADPADDWSMPLHGAWGARN
jgi:hypothetical protein